MLKKNTTNNTRTEGKKGSLKKTSFAPLSKGLNRRAFLKTGGSIAILTNLPSCKTDEKAAPFNEAASNLKASGNSQIFNAHELTTLAAVQMQLFPADGNGPSAEEINAIEYLQLAMQDPKNVDDGDPTFIKKGIGWLDDLANQTQGDRFVQLQSHQQEKLLKQIANSNAGENWLSLLIYYLTEALMLDPVYGGNPNEIGWQWLQHQAGFPRPVIGKTYRDFD